MMRPDERAGAAEVNRDQRTRSNIGKAIGTGAGVASAAIGARVMPFLSEYIPTDLAMKGLQKVAPQVAEFLKKGQSAGLDIKEGIDYVKNMINPKEAEQGEQQKPQEQQAQKPKENKNIIEQYSPELHQFIANEVASGRKPIEAGAVAQNDKRFADVIKKLSKDHNTPWSSIIDSIYGTGEQAGALKEQQQQSGQSGQMGQGQQRGSDWNSIKQDIENAMKS